MLSLANAELQESPGEDQKSPTKCGDEADLRSDHQLLAIGASGSYIKASTCKLS
jgi:hypothetical protein